MKAALISACLAGSQAADYNWNDAQDIMYPNAFEERLELAPLPGQADRNVSHAFQIKNEKTNDVLVFNGSGKCDYNRGECGVFAMKPTGADSELWLMDEEFGCLRSVVNDTMVLTFNQETNSTDTPAFNVTVEPFHD